MSKRLILGFLGFSSVLWAATVGAQVVAVQSAPAQSTTVALAVTGLTSDNASELLALFSKAGCACADAAAKDGSCCGTCGGDPAKCTAQAADMAKGTAQAAEPSKCSGACGGDPAKCSGACGGDPSKCTQGCADASKCSGGEKCAQGDECGKVVQNVTADAQAGEVHFQMVPGRTLRLSQINKALEQSAFRVDEKRLVLAGNPTLMVSGMTCGSCAADVQKRLGRLSPSAKATFVSMDESPVVLPSSGANVPRYADALAAMSGTSFTVRDVAWTAAACSGSCGDSCQGACDKQAKGAEKSGCSGGCAGTR